MKTVRLVILGVLLLGVLALLIERWHVTDEERVEAAWQDLVEAMETENRGRMAARLTPDMTFSGPARVGEGDREQALVALDGYWAQVRAVQVVPRKSEIVVQGQVASFKSNTLLRFEWGDSPVLYRVSVQIAWARVGEEWLARDIDVLEMTPGLF